MPDITTAQFDSFDRELEALTRNTSKRTVQGKMLHEVITLLKHPRVADEILRVAMVALGDHETLRRIRNEGWHSGHEAGYDQGVNDTLAERNYQETHPEEDD